MKESGPRGSENTKENRALGGVAEWLKAADCKSVDVRLRRFESYPLHHRSIGSEAPGTGRIGGIAPRVGQGGIRDAG